MGTFVAHVVFLLLAWFGAQYIHHVNTIANGLTFIILLASVVLTAFKLWQLRTNKGPVNSFE